MVMLGLGRPSGRTDQPPRARDDQEKKAVRSSQAGLAPVVFPGQRMGACAATYSVWGACGVG
jgi:hypothetical protein